MPCVEPSEIVRFFTIPLEIRDTIYRMLLTTKCCTQLAPTAPRLEFRFCTAILLANKQISAEATRVLWEENDFITLKVSGMQLLLQDVPIFRLAAGDNAINPVLQAEIEVVNGPGSSLTEQNVVTLITTPEGLQPIISAIWSLHNIEAPRASDRVAHGDLKLSLCFNLKATARYEVLKNLVLEPWTKINGVKELVLTGDIKDPMRERLQDYIHQGPFADEVAVSLQEYYSSAETELSQNNYNAARWWWTLLEDYWRYLLELRPYRLGGLKLKETDNAFRTVLREFLPLYFRGKLELVKTYLREFDYKSAVFHIDRALSWAYIWPWVDFNYAITPMLNTKFHLCVSLALTALGEIEEGMECLEDAAHLLSSSRQYCHGCHMDLIRLGSMNRCEWPESARRRWRRTGWEEGEGSHSFWEWLELAED
jgi:hypothetical protein